MSRSHRVRLFFLVSSGILLFVPNSVLGECQTNVIRGLFFGYFIASLSESLIHKYFGHAPKWMRALFERFPRILRQFNWTYVSHTIVHHGKTYKKDFVTQFESADQKKELLKSLPPWQQTQVRVTQFGLTIAMESFPYFMGPPAIIGLPVIYVFWGATASLSATLMLFIPPVLSMLVHPFIHKSYERALNEATGVMQVWVRSKFYRTIVRQHWMHHKYPRYNFNLMPGGDELLGLYCDPSAKDLLEMSNQGVPID